MVNSLLAILLVVNSRSGSGHNFVFHYPKTPQRRDEIEQSIHNDTISWPYGLSDDIDTRSLKSKVEEDVEENDFNNNSSCSETNQENYDDALIEQLSIISNHSFDDIESEVSSHYNLTFFHLIFVLEPPELELCRQVDNIYNNLITKLTAALHYEQLRCGYVSKESELILSFRDYSDIRTKDDLMNIILQKSSLAKTIKQVYDAISTDSIAHVLVNDYIDLSLQIPPLVPTTFINSSDNDLHGYEYAHYPVIAPYHTLLLLEDAEELLKNMPLDANPTLVNLVQILTPTQRLADLCTLLDCSLAQIFRLAAHLIFWRKAKIIDVINVRNVYVVSPTADMNSQHFPALDLVTILASLSTQKPYFLSAVITSKEHRTMYLEAITYLLRKDLVVQLHAYIFVMVPQYVNTEEENQEKLRMSNVIDDNNNNGAEIGIVNGDSQVNHSDNSNNINTSPRTNSTDPVVLISPYEKACDSEREWLNKLVINQPKETANLFERLIKYFNGKHHIEEILFRESIKPKDLAGLFENASSK
nr:8192_t:CDS:2 [Entrophospora candida]